jgi:hypothetical protein
VKLGWRIYAGLFTILGKQKAEAGMTSAFQFMGFSLLSF